MPAMARKPRRHSYAWMQGLGCGAMVALLPAMGLLLGVLLLPALLAVLYDRENGRPVARTVAMCGAAAAVMPMVALWNAGNTMDTSLALLSDLRVVGTAWSAAAAGWIVAELAPVAALIALEAVTHARAARLHAERTRLAEEWGFSEGQPPEG